MTGLEVAANCNPECFASRKELTEGAGHEDLVYANAEFPPRFSVMLGSITEDDGEWIVRVVQICNSAREKQPQQLHQ